MTQTTEFFVQALRQGCQLKRTPRMGWVQRGIPNAESVAAHSYGAAYTAMLLAQVIEEPIDLGRILSMAVIHDGTH